MSVCAFRKQGKEPWIALQRLKAAWQTGEAQRDRVRNSDLINRAPRDKRGNIETSSAAPDLG